MYMKVAVGFLAVVIATGCVSQKELNAPKKEKTQVAEPVVEVFDESNAASTTIMPLEENATIKVSKRSKRASHLKPEPFSLESNEHDPELLGPQTTLTKPLSRADRNSSKRM